MAHRGHVHVGFIRLRVGFLEVLKRRRPCKRAHHIGVDTVRAPLGCGHARQTADTFLRRRVRALAVVAEQTRAAGKVHHRPVRFLQMRVARLHVVKRRVQARVQRQVELLGGVVGNGNARRGRLRVVHQRIDAAKFRNHLINSRLHYGFVISLRVHIGGDGQHANAEFAFKAFSGRLKLLHVAAGDGKVCALFGKRSSNAETDRPRRTVLKRRETCAGDDDRLTSKVTHVRLLSVSQKSGRLREGAGGRRSRRHARGRRELVCRARYSVDKKWCYQKNQTHDTFTYQMNQFHVARKRRQTAILRRA